MFKLIQLLLVSLILTSCTDPDGAIQALKGNNLEPIQVGGYSFFGCGDDYIFATKFQAKNQKGDVVSGVVCSGFLKGNSLKFY